MSPQLPIFQQVAVALDLGTRFLRTAVPLDLSIPVTDTSCGKYEVGSIDRGSKSFLLGQLQVYYDTDDRDDRSFYVAVQTDASKATWCGR